MNKAHKILVFGGVDQLGRCLQEVSSKRDYLSILFLDEIEGNINDLNVLSGLFAKVKAQFVINCAAYTAVDKAEDDVELCEKIMDKAKIKKTFGLEIPCWRDSLVKCINN